MSQLGRNCPSHGQDGKVRNRRISPVAAHSGDRLLSEPTAGTQPCRRERLFMPLSGRSCGSTSSCCCTQSGRYWHRVDWICPSDRKWTPQLVYSLGYTARRNREGRPTALGNPTSAVGQFSCCRTVRDRGPSPVSFCGSTAARGLRRGPCIRPPPSPHGNARPRRP
jgi:hypothetical protein